MKPREVSGPDLARRCRLCHGSNLEPYLDLGMQPAADAFLTFTDGYEAPSTVDYSDVSDEDYQYVA